MDRCHVVGRRGGARRGGAGSGACAATVLLLVLLVACSGGDPDEGGGDASAGASAGLDRLPPEVELTQEEVDALREACADEFSSTCDSALPTIPRDAPPCRPDRHCLDLARAPAGSDVLVLRVTPPAGTGEGFCEAARSLCDGLEVPVQALDLVPAATTVDPTTGSPTSESSPSTPTGTTGTTGTHAPTTTPAEPSP